MNEWIINIQEIIATFIVIAFRIHTLSTLLLRNNRTQSKYLSLAVEDNSQLIINKKQFLAIY